MTASSDLDLILLYEHDLEAPDSDGERSLHGTQYFARFTQRLISAFTTRTNYGVLYDVDMRLRPSGARRPGCPRGSIHSPTTRSARPGPGSIWR